MFKNNYHERFNDSHGLLYSGLNYTFNPCDPPPPLHHCQVAPRFVGIKANTTVQNSLPVKAKTARTNSTWSSHSCSTLIPSLPCVDFFSSSFSLFRPSSSSTHLSTTLSPTFKEVKTEDTLNFFSLFPFLSILCSLDTQERCYFRRSLCNQYFL